MLVPPLNVGLKVKMAQLDMKKWNDFACGPRCLMELLRIRQGSSPTAQDLYDEFRPFLPLWEDQPGVADPGLTKALAKPMGVAKSGKESTDSAEIAGASKDPAVSGILGFAKKWPSGNGGFNRHIVIMKPSDNGFDVWSPTQDGRSTEEHGLPWTAFYEREMEAQILYK